MFKKLHISLIFSILVVLIQLSTIIVDMRNFITKFGKILEICKHRKGESPNLHCFHFCNLFFIVLL